MIRRQVIAKVADPVLDRPPLHACSGSTRSAMPCPGKSCDRNRSVIDS
jgi:hypothetical protein